MRRWWWGAVDWRCDMKSGFSLIVAMVLAVFGFFELLPAEDRVEPATFVLDGAASRITFDCEADLHDFSGTGTGLVGQVNVDVAQASQRLSGEVTLPVAKIDTGDKGRDEDMREEVLPAKKHPLIRFTPLEVKADEAVGKGGKMALKGSMEINGVARDMVLDVTVVWTSPGQFRIRGSHQFKLTDFKIDPPGAIWPMRVHDEMTFRIDLVFKKS